MEGYKGTRVQAYKCTRVQAYKCTRGLLYYYCTFAFRSSSIIISRLACVNSVRATAAGRSSFAKARFLGVERAGSDASRYCQMISGVERGVERGAAAQTAEGKHGLS
eukprot:9467959-Pyramimonas_sp.AAC.2